MVEEEQKIGKDVMPEKPEDLDGYMKNVNDFVERFQTLVQAVVYLWKIRDLVSEQTLKELQAAVFKALNDQCEVCGGAMCWSVKCPVEDYLRKLQVTEDAEVEPGTGSEVHS